MTIATVNGVNINYQISGHGEPVLLWHGFLGTRFAWRKVEPLLAKRFTVLTPDMRGYGDSAKPKTGYDAETLAEDFRALTQSLSLGKLHIIAHDMGAPAALLWAGRYPDEIATLAYVEEPVLTSRCLSQVIQFSPEGTRKGGLWWWLFALASDMPERLVTGKERQFLMWFYQNYSAAPGSIEEAAVAEYLRTFHGPEGIGGAWGVYRAIWDSVRQTETLERNPVRVPVLAVGGAGSMGPHVAEMVKSVASNVEGLTVQQSGHFVPEEQPESFSKSWLDFVGKHAAHGLRL